MQFGITNPGKQVPVRNLSVVAVVPGENSSENLLPKIIFLRTPRNGSVAVKGRWELGYGDDNCVKPGIRVEYYRFFRRGSVSKDPRWMWSTKSTDGFSLFGSLGH